MPSTVEIAMFLGTGALSPVARPLLYSHLSGLPVPVRTHMLSQLGFCHLDEGQEYVLDVIHRLRGPLILGGHSQGAHHVIRAGLYLTMVQLGLLPPPQRSYPEVVGVFSLAGVFSGSKQASFHAPISGIRCMGWGSRYMRRTLSDMTTQANAIEDFRLGHCQPRLPTFLLLAGDRDAVVVPSSSSLPGLPGTKQHLIRGADHHTILSHPSSLALLDAFVRSIAGSLPVAA